MCGTIRRDCRFVPRREEKGEMVEIVRRIKAEQRKTVVSACSITIFSVRRFVGIIGRVLCLVPCILCTIWYILFNDVYGFRAAMLPGASHSVLHRALRVVLCWTASPSQHCFNGVRSLIRASYLFVPPFEWILCGLFPSC